MSEYREHAEITATIIKHLAEGDDPDDLILNICQNSGYSWAQAEKLLQRVQEEQVAAIATRQFPIMYLSTIFILVGGVALLGLGTYSIIESIILHEGLFPQDLGTYLLTGLDKANFPFSALQPAFYPYAKWILGWIVSPYTMIFFGIVMVTGSLLGMRDVWAEIFNK